MSDTIVPVTFDRMSYSGVLASPVMGKGRVEVEQVIKTVHPDGAMVMRVYHNEIEVYDSKAVVSRHNQPHLVDLLA